MGNLRPAWCFSKWPASLFMSKYNIYQGVSLCFVFFQKDEKRVDLLISICWRLKIILKHLGPAQNIIVVHAVCNTKKIPHPCFKQWKPSTNRIQVQATYVEFYRQKLKKKHKIKQKVPRSRYRNGTSSSNI